MLLVVRCSHSCAQVTVGANVLEDREGDLRGWTGAQLLRQGEGWTDTGSVMAVGDAIETASGAWRQAPL